MRELIVLAIIAVPLYLLVRLVAKGAGFLTGRRFRAYRMLAQRYRGRYENRGMSEPPTVSFPYNGSTVRVGLAPPVPGQSWPPRTRVVVRFGRGLPFRMELAPSARPDPPQPPRGTRPVLTGDLEFDRGFIVRSNDPEMARDFLREPARRGLAGLHRLGPPGGMLLSINPERMLVQVDRNLGLGFDGLAAAVREALGLHDALIAGVATKMSEGVSVIDSGPASASDSGPPVCKVCGGLIELGPRMTCRRCKAPHHRDCWEFIGSCSIFGCNGREANPS